MRENIFDSIQGGSEGLREQEEARRVFDRQMRQAICLLMDCQEGRVFLRWLGRGPSPQSILQLILEYEEGKHVQ